MAKKKTALYVEEDLHRRLKVRAAETGTSMTEILEQAVEQFLARDHAVEQALRSEGAHGGQ